MLGINHFVTIVLFVGACLIFVSYFRIRRLITEIPKGAVQRRWNDLRVLILFFVFCYFTEPLT